MAHECVAEYSESLAILQDLAGGVADVAVDLALTGVELSLTHVAGVE